MKKYKILKATGNTISALSFLLVLIGCAVDIDASSNITEQTIFIAMAMSAVCFLLGQFLANFAYFEATFLAGALVIFASIHKLLRKPGRVMRSCYNIKQRIGSSSRTFCICRDYYLDYVDDNMEEDYE